MITIFPAKGAERPGVGKRSDSDEREPPRREPSRALLPRHAAPLQLGRAAARTRLSPGTAAGHFRWIAPQLLGWKGGREDQQRQTARRGGRRGCRRGSAASRCGARKVSFPGAGIGCRASPSPRRAPREPKPAARAERPQLWSVLGSDEGLARGDLFA